MDFQAFWSRKTQKVCGKSLNDLIALGTNSLSRTYEPIFIRHTSRQKSRRYGSLWSHLRPSVCKWPIPESLSQTLRYETDYSAHYHWTVGFGSKTRCGRFSKGPI